MRLSIQTNSSSIQWTTVSNIRNANGGHTCPKTVHQRMVCRDGHIYKDTQSFVRSTITANGGSRTSYWETVAETGCERFQAVSDILRCQLPRSLSAKQPIVTRYEGMLTSPRLYNHSCCHLRQTQNRWRRNRGGTQDYVGLKYSSGVAMLAQANTNCV